jgi:hypothetical protein
MEYSEENYKNAKSSDVFDFVCKKCGEIFLKTKREISTQEKKNESLAMKVNELASLDNIKAVADLEGLSYNNDNIKLIISNKE